MRKISLSLLGLLFVLAAMLAVTLTPAAAQTSGKVNLECLTIKWDVEGADVAVTLLLSGVKVDHFVLTPDEPFINVHHHGGYCQMDGMFQLMPGAEPDHGKLEIAVTDKQGNNVYTHDGVLASW
ncbi:MAG: hypothetical protein KQI62_03580 [Deltaproteobacteria bacterium]|nr:hypothetical protein [Deltaproteobacteria bacterium]